MKSTSNALFLVLGILLVIGIIVLTPTNHALYAPKNQTKTDILKMYMAIWDAEAAEKKMALEILTDQSFDRHDYKSMLASFLKAKGLRLRFRYSAERHLEVIDLWGNPYLVFPRVDVLLFNPPKELSTDTNLYIWSAGPNGINEYGRGDDIFCNEIHR